LWEQPLPLLKRLDRSRVEILLQMIQQGINSPLTSSCGRLFDGVAALAGLRETVAFEGQAAMELEMVQSMESTSAYPWEIIQEQGIRLIQPQPIIRGVVEDVQRGSSAALISRRFHLTLVEVLSRVTREIRNETGIEKVVLGGGVFQNRVLLTGMEERLQREGFQVYSKALVPSNDGGIALGQAVAAHYINKRM
jgi:hydrogenase maturation protein HypF